MVAGVRSPEPRLRRHAIAAVVAAVWASAALAQPVDSLATPRPLAPAVEVAADSASRSPRGAVLRSAAVPGWGQIYNGQWLKAPVAAGGVVAAAIYFVDRQRQYTRFQRAALVAGCEVRSGAGDPNAEPPVADDPDRIALCADAVARYQGALDELNTGRTQPFSAGQLQTLRGTARGQRDVGAVIVFAAYALQLLDAYVIAELADFDVSEDLSLTVAPTARGGALSLRLTL